MPTRELNDSEKRLLKLLDRYESMIEARDLLSGKEVLTVHLIFMLDSITWVVNNGIDIVRCDFDEKNARYHAHMTKDQFSKYLYLCCKSIGWTVSLDGTVTTRDRMVIPTADKR